MTATTNTKQPYLLWSPDKVAQYLDIPHDQQSPLRILLAEEGLRSTGRGCASSLIHLDSGAEAHKLREAIYCETDVDVRLQRSYSSFMIAIYDTDNYSSFDDALSSGATYGTPSRTLTIQDLLDRKKMELIQYAIQTSCDCIGDDRERLQPVIVATDAQNTMIMTLDELVKLHQTAGN